MYKIFAWKSRSQQFLLLPREKRRLINFQDIANLSVARLSIFEAMKMHFRLDENKYEGWLCVNGYRPSHVLALLSNVVLRALVTVQSSAHKNLLREKVTNATAINENKNVNRYELKRRKMLMPQVCLLHRTYKPRDAWAKSMRKRFTEQLIKTDFRQLNKVERQGSPMKSLPTFNISITIAVKLQPDYVLSFIKFLT